MLRVPSSSRAVVAAGTRSCRAFATSSARRAVERNLPLSEDAEDADGDGDAGGRRRAGGGKDRGPAVPTLKQWLTGDGAQFKTPKRSRNWLGGDVPFPLNKTFKPPTPLSDRLKDAIWLMHDTDRVNHTPRHIAAEVGLSIPRVEAILKLKYLEKDWKKEGKQLQTGFSVGMERILGIEADKRVRRIALRTAKSIDEQLDWRHTELMAERRAEIRAPDRAETQAADAQSEAEGAEGVRARARYARMYWEMVSEADTLELESVVPRQLEQGREELARAREELRAAKSAPAVLLGVPEAQVLKHLTPAELEAVKDLPDDQKVKQPRKPAKTIVVNADNDRPTIKFTDVGGKFVDLEKVQKNARNVQRNKDRRSKRQPQQQ